MKHAIETAILALQRVAIAHPASDEHSRDMYRTVGDARHGLLKILPDVHTEETCPGHVASAADSKVCARCGVHVDSFRPRGADEH
jgi:hypothetical protein